MTIGSGVNKKLIFKEETTWGTKPSAGSAQLLRRETSTIDLTTTAVTSNEIRSDQQTSDSRNSAFMVQGSINAELSSGTYQDLMAATLRGSWASGATVTATTISFTASTSTISRSSGSWVTMGIKAYDLIAVSGAAQSGNNSKFLVLTVSATDLTVAGTLTDESAGNSITLAVDGKKVMIPTSGHTNRSFTIEHFYELGTTDHSERNVGCKFSSMNFDFKPNAMSKVVFGVMGKNQETATSQYYTSPTAETTNATMAGTDGALYISGTAYTNFTSMTIDINGNMQNGQVIGSKYTPDIFQGRFSVTGQMQAYFESAAHYNAFIAETELSIAFKQTDPSGESIIIKMPRVKFTGAAKDDKEVGGIIETLPFVALLPASSSTQDQSTIIIQDTSL